MKHILLNCIFLLMLQTVFAQISGNIIEANENSPLEYATAALFYEKDNSLLTGVITDQEGFFEIQNIPNGRYYLEASFIGYSIKTIRNLEISKTQKNVDLGVLKLQLGSQLGEIEIRSERSTVLHKIDRQVFDSKNFQSSQGGTDSKNGYFERTWFGALAKGLSRKQMFWKSRKRSIRLEPKTKL